MARVTGGRVIVDGDGSVRIGARTRLMAHHAPIVLRAEPGASVDIGSSVAVNYGTIIEAAGNVQIGDNVSLGPYCVISDRNGDDVQPITIGEGVWLATRVTVAPGSTIGAGSTVASGSVVEGDIPPGVLASGIPARVIRRLDAAPNADSEAPTRTTDAEAQSVEHHASPTSTLEPAEHSAEPVPPIASGVLISDFTIDPLASLLADGPQPVEMDIAPFGTVAQSLLSPGEHGTDLAVVWTHAESTLPSLRRLRSGEAVTSEAIESDVSEFAKLLIAGSQHYDCVVVPDWTRPPSERGLGLLDERPGGIGHGYGVANLALRSALANHDNVVVLDARRWITLSGARAYTERGWYEGKLPFSADVFAHAATDIRSAARALRVAPRKVLVVDLDNTLWGGVVGDDGPEGLRLGGHDAIGEAFADFQGRVRSLTSRGIILAIASKNDESTAMAAIDGLDTMVLRRSDFVTWRINWNDKAQNIADMAAELNLGLSSFVFIDDNPHERTRVREALPEVLVPEWPVDPTLYCKAFEELTCFDTLTAATSEDLERTQMYQVEAERQRSRSVTTSLDDWIKDLQIVVEAAPLDRSNLARTAQLLNKTNQMNLRTRRQSEAELWQWASEPQHETWCISVHDRLGDAGLTGIVSIEADGDTAHVVDFVMSCRIMGRCVERTMISVAASAAERLGSSLLVAELIETAKNAPCARFFEELAPAVDGKHNMAVEEFKEAPEAIDLRTGSTAAVSS